jgi:hypothetical protein
MKNIVMIVRPEWSDYQEILNKYLNRYRDKQRGKSKSFEEQAVRALVYNGSKMWNKRYIIEMVLKLFVGKVKYKLIYSYDMDVASYIPYTYQYSKIHLSIDEFDIGDMKYDDINHCVINSLDVTELEMYGDCYRDKKTYPNLEIITMIDILEFDVMFGVTDSDYLYQNILVLQRGGLTWNIHGTYSDNFKWLWKYENRVDIIPLCINYNMESSRNENEMNFIFSDVSNGEIERLILFLPPRSHVNKSTVNGIEIPIIYDFNPDDLVLQHFMSTKYELNAGTTFTEIMDGDICIGKNE